MLAARLALQPTPTAVDHQPPVAAPQYPPNEARRLGWRQLSRRLRQERDIQRDQAHIRRSAVAREPRVFMRTPTRCREETRHHHHSGGGDAWLGTSVRCTLRIVFVRNLWAAARQMQERAKRAAAAEPAVARVGAAERQVWPCWAPQAEERHRLVRLARLAACAYNRGGLLRTIDVVPVLRLLASDPLTEEKVSNWWKTILGTLTFLGLLFCWAIKSLSLERFF